ncbi:MAG: hypothetical protein K0R84_2108 [Clostridia bacterium]|jgi:hypothetical protein|nr:hypothetical protein [Clostridia bacterium]
MVVYILSNDVKEILTKLDMMSYLNIMSFSVLSGSGISVSPSLHDLDIIEELCRYMPPNQRPYNISFMSGLFKRSMPVNSRETDNPYNFEGYQWLDKRQKKVINVEVQACSISSCCSIIEKLITYRIDVENPQFIAFLLFKTALYQARFIKEHLRVGDIYYSGEAVAAGDQRKPDIQVSADEPDIMSQLAVMRAFTDLKRISSYNISFMTIDAAEFDEDLELLPHFCKNIIEHLPDIKSRELINIGLCIANIYVNTVSPNKTIYTALSKIGSELLKRINENGMIARTISDVEESSLRTSFNCLNLLSELYYMFSNKDYLQACMKIYSKLDEAWDKDHCIFKLKDRSKQTYTIKDVSAIISALLSFCCVAPNPKLSDSITARIKGFYDTAFAKSPIFVGQNRPILQQSLLKLDNSIEVEKEAAPVFNKSFDYKISKGKYYSEADIFRADYVLPACCLLLNNISNYCI